MNGFSILGVVSTLKNASRKVCKLGMLAIAVALLAAPATAHAQFGMPTKTAPTTGGVNLKSKVAGYLWGNVSNVEGKTVKQLWYVAKDGRFQALFNVDGQEFSVQGTWVMEGNVMEFTTTEGKSFRVRVSFDSEGNLVMSDGKDQLVFFNVPMKN